MLRKFLHRSFDQLDLRTRTAKFLDIGGATRSQRSIAKARFLEGRGDPVECDSMTDWQWRPNKATVFECQDVARVHRVHRVKSSLEFC